MPLASAGGPPTASDLLESVGDDVHPASMWLTLSINSHVRRLRATFIDVHIGTVELHVPEAMTRERSGASGLQRPDRRLRTSGAQCGKRRLDGLPSSILV